MLKRSSLITIQNYTILKRTEMWVAEDRGLITIQNYTILKLNRVRSVRDSSLITIQNYTILKPQIEKNATTTPGNSE